MIATQRSWSLEGLLRITNTDWLSFILEYLLSTTPDGPNGESVCSKSSRSNIEPTFEGQLLLNPQLVSVNDALSVSSDISPGTSYVWTIYGHALDGGSKRRCLVNAATSYIESSQSPRYYNSQLQIINGSLDKILVKSEQNGQRRRLQEDEGDEISSLIIFNGDMVSNYDGPSYSSVWNKVVYYLADGLNEDTFVYTKAYGDGDMAIQVLYFPYLWYQPIDSVSLPFAASMEDALALGAYFANLQFTVDLASGEVISPVSLCKCTP